MATQTVPPTWWSPRQIVSFMDTHPQRAYFSRFFRDGGFRSGMEVGVAGGRFSEHFLMDNAGIGAWDWTMMEPYPNKNFLSRYPQLAQSVANATLRRQYESRSQGKDSPKSWRARGIGGNARLQFVHALSTDTSALEVTSASKYAFIYLDGAHDYVNVKRELFAYWPKVAPGGVLAGHDYCVQPSKPPREKPWIQPGQTEAPLPLKCRGCASIPGCGVYTEYAEGKRGAVAKSQEGVVRAVQEWLAEAHPKLMLHHTRENFTAASLKADGMPYELIITKSRNPSWFVIKAPRKAL